MNQGTKRKFIIPYFPKDLEIGFGVIIRQSYLLTGMMEVRLRELASIERKTYTMRTKIGKELNQRGVELHISPRAYRVFRQFRPSRPLKKSRHRIIWENREFIMDIYQNADWEMLVTIEVEFLSKEEAVAFEPLKWFGKEITDDPDYKNLNLWKSIQYVGYKMGND